LVELVLVAGPVFAFAIYELIKLRRDAKPAMLQGLRDRQT
jgi:hypothetical protein